MLDTHTRYIYPIYTPNIYTQYIHPYTQYIYPIYIPNIYTRYIYPIYIPNTYLRPKTYSTCTQRSAGTFSDHCKNGNGHEGTDKVLLFISSTCVRVWIWTEKWSFGDAIMYSACP